MTIKIDQRCILECPVCRENIIPSDRVVIYKGVETHLCCAAEEEYKEEYRIEYKENRRRCRKEYADG